jgi:hypothetical protein
MIRADASVEANSSGIGIVMQWSSPGRYILSWWGSSGPLNIQGCAVQATLVQSGLASGFSTNVNGEISAQQLALVNYQTAVNTFDSSGNLANRPFHVVLFCN